METEHKILVVHNDKLVLTLITDALTKAGYITRQATGGYSALSIAGDFQPELVVLSIELPDLSVMETLLELKGMGESALKVILLTSKDTKTTLITEMGNLVDDSITWPASNRELLAKVHSTLRIRESHQELLKSKERYQTIFETVPISIWEEDFTELMQLLENLRNSGVIDLRKYMQDNPDFAEKAARSVMVIDVNQITLPMFHAKDKQEFLRPLDFFFKDGFKPFEEQLLALWNGSKYFEQEFVHKTFDGAQITVHMSIQYPDTREQFSRVYVLKADITEKKRQKNLYGIAGTVTKKFLMKFQSQSGRRILAGSSVSSRN